MARKSSTASNRRTAPRRAASQPRARARAPRARPRRRRGRPRECRRPPPRDRLLAAELIVELLETPRRCCTSSSRSGRSSGRPGRTPGIRGRPQARDAALHVGVLFEGPGGRGRGGETREEEKVIRRTCGSRRTWEKSAREKGKRGDRGAPRAAATDRGGARRAGRSRRIFVRASRFTHRDHVVHGLHLLRHHGVVHQALHQPSARSPFSPSPGPSWPLVRRLDLLELLGVHVAHHTGEVRGSPAAMVRARDLRALRAGRRAATATPRADDAEAPRLLAEIRALLAGARTRAAEAETVTDAIVMRMSRVVRHRWRDPEETRDGARFTCGDSRGGNAYLVVRGSGADGERERRKPLSQSARAASLLAVARASAPSRRRPTRVFPSERNRRARTCPSRHELDAPRRSSPLVARPSLRPRRRSDARSASRRARFEPLTRRSRPLRGSSSTTLRSRTHEPS